MFRNLLFLVVFLVSVPVQAGEKTILVLADSLSASYGIAIEEGWVSLLQERLHEQAYPYKVLNTSISGDTTHGALARLDAILKDGVPDITVVELGGNDGLRGLPVTEIRKNLEGIIVRLMEAGSEVLLVPMLLPPNYGQFYIDRFTGIYRELAEDHEITLSRFILEGIADKPELMQDDGIHPTAEAQGMMLDNIWEDLESLIMAGSRQES
ncbi:MAG: arylesterase [Gammaproteobacteria bacterium]